MLEVDILTKETMRAQFRVDAEGAVREFGVALVPELEEELIWFQRIMADGN